MKSIHSNYAHSVIALVIGLTLAFSLVGVVGAHEEEATATFAEVDGQSRVGFEDDSTGDVDGDGYADPEFHDEDSDDDGILDTADAGANAEPEADFDDDVRAKELDKSTPKLQDTPTRGAAPNTPDTLRAHELMHVVQQRAAAQDIVEGALRGVEIDFRDEDSDGDGLDDGASQRPGDPIPDIDITVRAVEVRGWDPQTKEAVRERLAELADEIVADNPQLQTERFGLYTAVAALDNEKIIDIKVSDLVDENTDGRDFLVWQRSVEVSYAATLKLFGLFNPKEYTVKKTVVGDSDGNIIREDSNLEAPWHVRLFSWGDKDADEMLDIASDIALQHAAGQTGNMPDFQKITNSQ